MQDVFHNHGTFPRFRLMESGLGDSGRGFVLQIGRWDVLWVCCKLMAVKSEIKINSSILLCCEWSNLIVLFIRKMALNLGYVNT